MPLSTEKEIKPEPPCIVFYGVQGFGKTTFAGLAPRPIFIRTEDGLKSGQFDDIPRYPIATNFQTVIKQLEELETEDHDRETLVVDSLDWLEPLIWSQVCDENNIKNISDLKYGKGYMQALDLWQQYIEIITNLQKEKNMMIIQIAHTKVKTFESPETESYDRYLIKLHDKAAEKVAEHADIVIFGNYYTAIKTDKSKFGKERLRAIGGRERILYTTERAAAPAKNRYDLPDEIIFDKDGEYWQTIKNHIPFFNQTRKDDDNG